MEGRMRHRARPIARRWRSPRRILAALAANSVIWRLLPDLSELGLARILAVLAENEIVSIILAILSLQPRNFRLIGILFEQFLFLYLIYRYLPRILPKSEPASTVFDTRNSKTLLLVIIGGIALPLAEIVPSAWDSSLFLAVSEVLPHTVSISVTPLDWFYSWVVTSWIVIILYLYVYWWREASVEDRVRIMNQLAGRGMTPEQRDEEIEALTRDGWLSPVSNCFAILAGTGSILVMSFILGVTAGSASMLFPLPELVVLLGVSVQLLTPHLPNRELENRVTSLRQRFTDFEPRFYIFIRSFRNTRKGLFLTLIVAFAFMLVLLVNLLSLVSLVGLAFLVVGIASKISLAVGSYPIRSWNALGFFLCSATPGLYGLWFWYRETYRLPHFLVYWRNNQPNGHEIEPTDDLPQLVTRPPGYLLPPTILWIPVIWSLNGLNGGDPAIPDSILFSVGWVLAFLGVLWTVRWTFRNEPQPPKTDGRAILSSFYIQLTWLWIIFGGWVFPIKLVSIPELALMALLISILYFYDDFMIHLEYKLEFSELGITWGNVGLAGLLLVLLMVLVTTRVNPTNEWPLIGVGILLVILGLLNSIVVLMGKRA